MINHSLYLAVCLNRIMALVRFITCSKRTAAPPTLQNHSALHLACVKNKFTIIGAEWHFRYYGLKANYDPVHFNDLVLGELWIRRCVPRSNELRLWSDLIDQPKLQLSLPL